MKNIRNKIIIVIGFLFVFFILWNRFIRIRLPRSIYDIPSNMRIIILIILCTLYILVLIYLIRKMFNIQPRTNGPLYKLLQKIVANKIVIQIHSIINIYLLEAPKTLFKYIYSKIKIRFFTLVIGSYLMVYTVNYSFSLFMITNIVPRIIVVVTFLIDIFYFQYLEYFYRSLILLAIPLIFNFIIFLIGYLCEENMLYLQEYVDFCDNETKISFKRNITYKEDPIIEQTVENLQKFANDWDIITTIYYQFSKKFYDINEEFKDYIRVFTYSMYLVGWTYYLSISYNPQYIVRFSLISISISIFIYLLIVTIIIVKHYKIMDKVYNLSHITMLNNTKHILKDYLIFNDFIVSYIENNICIYFVLLSFITILINNILIYIHLSHITIILLILSYNCYLFITNVVMINNPIKIHLIEVYAWFYDKLYMRTFVIKYGNLLLKYFVNKYKFLYYIIFISRIIMLFNFNYIIILDINYMVVLSFIIIRLISCSFLAFIYVLSDLTYKNMLYMEEDLYITSNKEELIIKLKDKYSTYDLEDYAKKYIEVFNINKFIDKFIIYIGNNNYYINPYINVIYIVLCVYYLFQQFE